MIPVEQVAVNETTNGTNKKAPKTTTTTTIFTTDDTSNDANEAKIADDSGCIETLQEKQQATLVESSSLLKEQLLTSSASFASQQGALGAGVELKNKLGSGSGLQREREKLEKAREEPELASIGAGNVAVFVDEDARQTSGGDHIDDIQAGEEQQQVFKQRSRAAKLAKLNCDTNSLTSLFAHVNEVKHQVAMLSGNSTTNVMENGSPHKWCSQPNEFNDLNHQAQDIMSFENYHSSMRKLSSSLRSDAGSSSSGASTSSLTPQVYQLGETSPFANKITREEERLVENYGENYQQMASNHETLLKLEQLMRKRDELKSIDKQLFEMINQYTKELDSNSSNRPKPLFYADQTENYKVIDLSLPSKSIAKVQSTGQLARTERSASINLKKSRLLGAFRASSEAASRVEENFDKMNLLKDHISPVAREVSSPTAYVGAVRDNQFINHENFLQSSNSSNLVEVEMLQQMKRFRSNSTFCDQRQSTYSDNSKTIGSGSMLADTAIRAGSLPAMFNEALRYHYTNQLCDYLSPNNNLACILNQKPPDPMEMEFVEQHQSDNSAYILATGHQRQQYVNSQDLYNQQQVECANHHSLSLTPNQQSLELVRASMAREHQLAPLVADYAPNQQQHQQQKAAFKCHVCGSGFEDRHRLQQHLSIHLNLHPSWFEEKTIKETMAQYESKRGDYLCSSCNLRFETTAEYDKHMQLHGDKPHRCELCDQDNKLISFRYYRQLLTHLRSHCFLYSCRFAPDCKQTANRKDYLKLHILKHHLNNKLPEQYTICCH